MACALCSALAANLPGPPVAVMQSGSAIINAQLELPIYPGGRILKHQNGPNGSSEVWFETNADLERVYEHFHTVLIARNWKRTSIESKPARAKIEAMYERQGTRFKLQLERQVQGFKLEIEF